MPGIGSSIREMDVNILEMRESKTDNLLSKTNGLRLVSIKHLPRGRRKIQNFMKFSKRVTIIEHHYYYL